MISFEAFVVLQVILNVVLFCGLISTERRMKGYRRMVQLMTAESSVVKTDPALIKEWVITLSRLPKDSPKRAAYTNRLIEVGHLKS